MASTTSFKQQCPSCEAMVPIRDPGLIGRKIDCPKCKYRFVVESPDQAEAEEEEAPAKAAKKAKPGSSAVTTKPGAKPAAKAKTRPGARKDAEDDEAEGKPKKKKSGGSSKVLVLGIGLAVVAVVALGVGAFLLFGGKEKTKKSSSPPSVANMGGSGAPNAGTPEGAGGEVKGQPTKDGNPSATANLGDPTNLLPNDTQAVVSVPTPRLLGSPLRRAALSQGGFSEEHFRATLGVPLEDVSRVVMALSLTNDWVFTVVRTAKPVNKDHLAARLRLSPEPPINNLAYSLVRGRLDSLSNLLFTAGRPGKALALHVVDPHTLVFADVAPMKKFLQDKGHPKPLTTGAPAEAPAGVGEQGPGGPGRGRGMRPGAMTPPEGGSGPPSMPGRGRGSMGPPSAMMPPGFGGPGAGGGEGEAPAAAPATGSYLTIDPALKSVLDKIEKAEKGEPAVLLTGVVNGKVAIDLLLAKLGGKAFIDQMQAQVQAELKKNKEQLPQGVNIKDADIEKGIKALQQELVVLGFSLTALSEEKLGVAAAVETKSREVAEGLEQGLKFGLPFGLPELKKQTGLNITMAESQGGSRFQPGGPGMPGIPGAGGSMRLPGGPGMPGSGGSMRPPGMPFGPPGVQGPGGRGGSMRLPGGFEGPGGANEEQKDEPKDGTIDVSLTDKTVVVSLDLKLKDAMYQKLMQGVSAGASFLKGQCDMAVGRSSVHELAAATQAYLRDKGHFPQGALPRSPSADRVIAWRPDQRLSWAVELLPYLQDGDFRDLPTDREQSWDQGINLQAAEKVIPQFLALNKGDKPLALYLEFPDRSGKFVATNFVGIAGVGYDAAEYAANDPAVAKKLGVFGYERVTRREDVKDGLDKTIALIQVPHEQQAPWIAGGGSTVRGVSEDADCVRPFVCVKYKMKPGDREEVPGTFAVMGDGKVRFIPASIDPRLFRAMCTIAGGEEGLANIDVIAPVVPGDEEDQPELKTKPDAPRPVPPAAPPKPAAPAAPRDARSQAILTNQMKQIVLAYHNHVAATNKPPAKAEDIGPYVENDVKILNLLKNGEVVVLWGSSFKNMTQGTSNTVLGYEKDAPKNGGLVMMADGSVKKMTADEFGKATKAAGK